MMTNGKRGRYRPTKRATANESRTANIDSPSRLTPIALTTRPTVSSESRGLLGWWQVLDAGQDSLHDVHRL